MAAVLALAAACGGDSNPSGSAVVGSTIASVDAETADSTVGSATTASSSGEATVSLEELLEMPIDELPSDMYSTRPCESVLTEPPEDDVFSDYDNSTYDLDEIVERVPEIFVARVVESGSPVVFTPDGVPRDYLDAVGASDPSDLALGGTTVTLEVIDTARGAALVGDQLSVMMLGCWSPDATALTTPRSDVLVLGSEPSANRGIAAVADTDLNLLEWFAVGDDQSLTEGDAVVQLPGPYRMLEEMAVDEALTAIRAVDG